MKAKYFLLGFLLLTVGAFCATANTRAADYSIGPPTDTPGQKEITVIDEDGLEDLFEQVDLDEGGVSWQNAIMGYIGGAPYGTYVMGFLGDGSFANNPNIDDLGAKVQSQIDWVNESDDKVMYNNDDGEYDEYDVFTVHSDTWAMIDPANDFNPKPDNDEAAYVFAMDPDDYNQWFYQELIVTDVGESPDDWEEGANTMATVCMLGFSTFFILPIPVADYLDEIEWQDEDFTYQEYGSPAGDNLAALFGSDYDTDDFTHEWYSDGLTVTHEGSIWWVDDGDLEVDDYIEVWTWGESYGTLDTYQLMNDDEDILWELGAVSAIPGYELPILLGVTAAFVIGIIYVIRKRK
ncbi:MAG: hypothetical protein ACFFAN_14440 [Promethearchaeota archaeon]